MPLPLLIVPGNQMQRNTTKYIPIHFLFLSYFFLFGNVFASTFTRDTIFSRYSYQPAYTTIAADSNTCRRSGISSIKTCLHDNRINPHSAFHTHLHTPPSITSRIYNTFKCLRPSLNYYKNKRILHPQKYQSNSVTLQSFSDDFIDAILGQPQNNNNNDNDSENNYDNLQKYTHMIGIPLESNHDLALELESIQRGILYHCPLLINSCITSAVVRMPLLYVDTQTSSPPPPTTTTTSTTSETSGSDTNTNDNNQDGYTSSSSSPTGSSSTFPGMPSPNDFFQRSRMATDLSSYTMNDNDSSSLLTSRDPITKILHEIVQDVVQDMICVPNDSGRNNDNNEEEQGKEGQEMPVERNGVNQDNIQPLLIRFCGLEMDGDQNEVLHAIAIDEEDEEHQQDATTTSTTSTTITSSPTSSNKNNNSNNNTSGVKLLRNVVMEIKRRVEQEHNWNVIFPSDNPQGKTIDNSIFRPRIPFMRLPPNFHDTLPDPKGPDGKWQDYSEEEKENYVRFPEEGGNGISPIFWYKWWDDTLCKGPVRIRELAVYGRTAPLGLSETSFYVPHLRTKLPDGNSMLQQEEARHQDYDSERRIEQERLAEQEEMEESFRTMQQESQRLDESGTTTSTNSGINGSATSSSTVNTDKDMRQMKSKADRRMIQTIYESSPDTVLDVGDMMDIDQDIMERLNDEEKGIEKSVDTPNTTYDMDQDDISQDSNMNVNQIDGDTDTITSTPNENIDTIQNTPSKADQIIQSIAKPIATNDWSSLSKKNKPKPEDNPIFQRWRKSQENNDATNVFGQAPPTPKKKTRVLPPYPSNEHFVGLWRLVSLPGGGQTLDEQRRSGDLSIDSSVSENLILRVDGSTAGGPILNSSTGHRAAGGSWQFFEAEYIGKKMNTDTDNNDDDGDKDVYNDQDSTMIQTRLRIRLLIPPAKEQVLVMEGELKRGVTSSIQSVSEENIQELWRTSTNSILNASNQIDDDSIDSGEVIVQDDDNEIFLTCSGEVWLEDVISPSSNGKKRKRKKLGRFSLLKMKDEDPDEYQYTIPAPRRYQD